MVLSAVLALGASATAACGGSSGSGSAEPKPEHTKLVVGVVKGEIGALPLYTGVDQGYFKRMGLDVQIVDDFVSDQEAMSALHDKRVDVVYDDYAHAFEVQSLGTMRLRLIAEGYVAGDGGVQLAEVSSNRQNAVADDVAKAFETPGGILVPSTGDTDQATDISVPTLMLMNALPSVRNDFKVDQGNLGSHIKSLAPDHLGAALAAKQAPAAVLAEPYLTAASSASALSPLLDLTSGGNAAMPLGGYFAEADHALDYVNTLKVFNDALNQAKTAASQRSMATVELAARYTYLPNINTVTTGILLGTFPLTVSADRLTRVLTLAQKAGLAPYMDLSSILPTGAINNSN
jgi:ABC-type nitrate/sulfonate/bicarbonate transport system substrate-binding protein